MHRFIGGVHLGGIFLAAIALAVPWRWAISKANLACVVGVLALTLLVLSPLYIERKTFLSDKTEVQNESQMALDRERKDVDEIVKTLRELPPGRVYAGMTDEAPTLGSDDRWGQGYRIGNFIMADLLASAGLDVFSSSLHDYSLSSSPENSFNENRPEQYNLFNVRYVVVPQNAQMPMFMKPLKIVGRHQIYQVETTGYFDLVGSRLSFAGSKEEFRSNAMYWLTSELPKAKLHPRMSINGSPKHQDTDSLADTVLLIPTASEHQPLDSLDDLNSYVAQTSTNQSRGLIISEDVGPDSYETVVDVTRESILMLKTTFHPNWRIVVNGSEKNPVMLMPGFMGVQLPPGEHVVKMEYQSRNLRKILLCLGFLSLVAVAILERRGLYIIDRMKSWIITRISKPRLGNQTRRSRRTRR